MDALTNRLMTSHPLACRLLPYDIADGATNMAADEVLLRAAFEGEASLRFYGWSEPTLSLGYFQPAQVRRDNSLWQDLPWVRRASGGFALLHHHELTYALALPPGEFWQPRGSWLDRVHAVIKRALETLGLGGNLTLAEDNPAPTREPLCFQLHTPGDLLCAGFKIAGSAQRKGRQCLLQHGAILLKRSAFAPHLPGIEDLCDVAIEMQELMNACLSALREATGWSIQPENWQPAEEQAIVELKRKKYAASEWNEKR